MWWNTLPYIFYNIITSTTTQLHTLYVLWFNLGPIILIFSCFMFIITLLPYATTNWTEGKIEPQIYVHVQSSNYCTVCRLPWLPPSLWPLVYYPCIWKEQCELQKKKITVLWVTWWKKKECQKEKENKQTTTKTIGHFSTVNTNARCCK